MVFKILLRQNFRSERLEGLGRMSRKSVQQQNANGRYRFRLVIVIAHERIVAIRARIRAPKKDTALEIDDREYGEFDLLLNALQHLRHLVAFGLRFREMVANHTGLGNGSRRNRDTAKDILEGILEYCDVCPNFTLTLLGYKLKAHFGQPLKVVVHDALQNHAEQQDRQ